MGHWEDLRKQADAKNARRIGALQRLREMRQRKAERERPAREAEEERIDREQAEAFFRDLGFPEGKMPEPTEEAKQRFAQSQRANEEAVARQWQARLDAEDFEARQESMSDKDAIDELERRHQERESGERSSESFGWHHDVGSPPAPRRRTHPWWRTKDEWKSGGSDE